MTTATANNAALYERLFHLMPRPSAKDIGDASPVYGRPVWGDCPCHVDGKKHGRRSLQLHPDKGVTCFAGCDRRAVRAALEGPTMTTSAPKRRIAATFDYHDRNGKLLYQVVRYDPKGFSQRRPDPKKSGGWEWSLNGTQRVPYRLPELVSAPPDATVWIPEGEKHVDALRKLGLVATCNPEGAGKWRLEFSTHLKGRRVVVLPDNDDAGRGHADTVARFSHNVVADVRVLALPGLAEKGDVLDWLAAGGTRAQLEALAASTPVWDTAFSSYSSFSSYSVVSENAPEPFPATSLPSVEPFPTHVLPATVRRLVEEGAVAMAVPPDMIAVPLLVNAGAAIGNGQRIRLKEGFEQSPILFGAVVAPPGSAKTPAQDLANYPLKRLQWEAWERFQGEMDLYNVAVTEWSAAKKGERGPEPSRPALEHYFSTDSTMEAAYTMLQESAGFVLIRDELVSWVAAFDAYRGGKGGDRQNWLSLWAGQAVKIDRKNADPIFIPDPVVSVAGGIQPDMLEELADEAGRRDGFLERILWSYPDVRPAGWTEETVSSATKEAVVSLFRRLRRPARAEHPVELDPMARALWASWYDQNAELTAQAGGLAQGIYAKLPNQLARLALILHCLTHPDNPTGQAVSSTTLAGAIELVEYFRSHAHRTLTHFGVAAVAASGGLAVRVLRVLDQHEEEHEGEWMPRDALYEKLGRNVPASQLSRALADLASLGQAEHRTAPPQGKGRPPELWRKLREHPYEKNEEYEENATGEPP